MPWAAIENQEENGELITHIMPVVEVKKFKTKKECEAFCKKVEDAGLPCINDERGYITATYFGHRLSLNCPCKPQQHSVDPGMYIHGKAQ